MTGWPDAYSPWGGDAEDELQAVFTYTGSLQTFTIPTYDTGARYGVLELSARGGRGAGLNANLRNILSLSYDDISPGIWTVLVGGDASGTSGGYGGGGDGGAAVGAGYGDGGGGGGGSFIYAPDDKLILVAGGSGGPCGGSEGLHPTSVDADGYWRYPWSAGITGIFGDIGFMAIGGYGGQGGNRNPTYTDPGWLGDYFFNYAGTQAGQVFVDSLPWEAFNPTFDSEGEGGNYGGNGLVPSEAYRPGGLWVGTGGDGAGPVVEGPGAGGGGGGLVGGGGGGAVNWNLRYVAYDFTTLASNVLWGIGPGQNGLGFSPYIATGADSDTPPLDGNRPYWYARRSVNFPSNLIGEVNGKVAVRFATFPFGVSPVGIRTNVGAVGGRPSGLA